MLNSPGYTFSAYRIAEKALRKIGAFPITDSAADPMEMREALDWLSIILADLAGEEPIFWLIPATLTIPLTAGVNAYDVQATMGNDYPELGIQFPIEAFVEDDAGNREWMEIVSRTVWDGFPDRDATGPITHLYVDRLYPPTLYTYPTLADTSKQWSVKMTVQTFAPDFQGNTDKATGLRSAWQMWSIYQLASCLGDGSIRSVPEVEVRRFERRAADSKRKLFAYENREHESTPPVCRFIG